MPGGAKTVPYFNGFTIISLIIRHSYTFLVQVHYENQLQCGLYENVP